jgi:hypothetical protein
MATPSDTPREPNGGAGTAPTPTSLPSVATDLPAGEILRKLDAAARRGKLAGFQAGDAGGAGPLFTVRDVGTPFDGEVVARLADGRLTFTTRLYRKFPAIFAAILVLSVWPGVWLMESLMNAYFPSIGEYTWWWYVPLTVLSGPPAMIGALKKSRAMLHADAVGAVEAVGKALG